MTKINILKSKEVAEMLGVDIRTIQKLAKENYYPPEVCGKIGKQYIFNADLLFSFLFSGGEAI